MQFFLRELARKLSYFVCDAFQVIKVLCLRLYKDIWLRKEDKGSFPNECKGEGETKNEIWLIFRKGSLVI